MTLVNKPKEGEMMAPGLNHWYDRHGEHTLFYFPIWGGVMRSLAHMGFAWVPVNLYIWLKGKPRNFWYVGLI